MMPGAEISKLKLEVIMRQRGCLIVVLISVLMVGCPKAKDVGSGTALS